MTPLPENPYQSPPLAAGQIVDDEYLFNQRFRRRATRWASLLQLGVPILIPFAMVAAGCAVGAYPGVGAWVWAIATIVMTCWLSFIVADRVITMGYESVQTQLQDRLSAEGIKLQNLDATFIQFSPARRPYLYDNFTNWDVGFLVFFPARIVYFGDRTRFALTLSQVQAIKAAPGFDPRHPRSIYISWREQSGGRGNVFSVEAGVGNSAKKLQQSNDRLEERLQQWVAGNVEPNDAAEPGKHLPPPRVAAHGGKLFRQVANPLSLLIATVWIASVPAWLSNLIAMSQGVWTPDIMWPLAIGGGAGSAIIILRGAIHGWATDFRRYPFETMPPDN